MFKKTSLLIVLAIAFMLVAGTAGAQFFDWESDGGFGIYGFAELGLVLQMAFAAPNETYFTDDADLFVADLHFGAESFTPLFAFYPQVSVTVWEGDEQGIGSIDVFGRLRIRWGQGWKAAPKSFECYGASVVWNFADTAYLQLYNGNVALEYFGNEVYYDGMIGKPYVELGFDLEMMLLNIRLTGPFGLDMYGTGTWVVSGADGFEQLDLTYQPYHFWIEANNIDLDIITLSVGVGYEFLNTFNWDSATFYGSDIPEDALGVKAGYPVWYIHGWFEKAGALLFSLDFDMTMENLISVGLYEEFYMGMTSGAMMNDVVLDIWVLAVPGLDVNLNVELYLDLVMGGEVDGYVINPSEIGYVMPVKLWVAYTVDLGGMSLQAFLNVGADVAGQLFYMDDPDISRGWFLGVGANLYVAGDYIRIPFEVMITNSADVHGSTGYSWILGQQGNYLTHGYFYGYDTVGTTPLVARIWLSLGIIFELD